MARRMEEVRKETSASKNPMSLVSWRELLRSHPSTVRETLSMTDLEKEPQISSEEEGEVEKKPQLPTKWVKKKWVFILAVVIFLLILVWIYWIWRFNQGKFMPPPPSPPRFCPKVPVVHQGEDPPFVPVRGTKTLLISAHLEPRAEKNTVRVIAVVMRSEAVEYRCHFRCQEHLFTSKADYNNDTEHFDFAYGVAFIMCPFPSRCEAPFHISVTTAANYNQDEHQTEFLEVKQQKVDSSSFPYTFTVCFSVMFNFTNVLQLVQSLEMLQLLGVSRVVIYKTDCSPETQRILDCYTDKGLVEVIPWSMSRYLNVSHSWNPELGPGDIHYYGQIPALNDCVYRYMYRSKYVALHDIDELILPQSVNSWTGLLPELEKKYGADKCYQFENNVFPNTIKLSPPPPQTLPLQERWKNVPGVNIFSHLYQQPVDPKTFNSNFKIIVNPRAVFSATVHGLVSSTKGCSCSWVDRNIARMYHTRAATRNLPPDQLIYDGRLLSFKDNLTPAVDTVLTDTGFLPKENKS